MRRIKVQAEKVGGHYHVGFFCGEAGYTLGGLGKLVMDEQDWQAFKMLLHDGAQRVSTEVVEVPVL